MIVGTNAHDTGLDGQEWTVSDDAGLQRVIDNHFKDFAPKFAEFYRPALYGGSAGEAARAVIADGPAAELALVLRARTPDAAPLYSYLWTHALPGDFGPVHSSELAYVYETLPTLSSRNLSAEDYAISRQVNQYWINFIKSGDPNHGALPHWPGKTMELGDHFAARLLFTPGKLEAYQDYADHGGRFGLP